MNWQQKKVDAMQIVLLAALGISLLCIVIALVIKLNGLKEEEKIPLEQLVQQYWLEQTKDTPLAISPPNEMVNQQNSVADLNSVNESDQPMVGDQVNIAASEITTAQENAVQELNSGETELKSSSESGKIDINTATAEELQQLNGIGPSKAAAIVADREQKGKFKRIEDIKRVKGIGEKVFERIKESIVANP